MPIATAGAVVGIVSGISSLYYDWRASEAEKKAMEKQREALERAGQERVEYQPVTEEELDAMREAVNLRAEAQIQESVSQYADQMAAAGYDPQEAVAQARMRLEPQRQALLDQVDTQMRATDLVSERQHIMQEDMRLIENELALAGLPQPGQYEAQRYSGIASGARELAGMGAELYGRYKDVETPPEERPTRPQGGAQVYRMFPEVGRKLSPYDQRRINALESQYGGNKLRLNYFDKMYRPIGEKK